MILAYALKNPQATNEVLETYRRPGTVDAAQLSASLADFAQQTVGCYHPSARFRGVEVLAAPWSEQAKFGAAGSLVMRIYMTGLSGSVYQMIVAGMAKERAYRAFVISENTLVPYNKRCQLERWVAVAEE